VQYTEDVVSKVFARGRLLVQRRPTAIERKRERERERERVCVCVIQCNQMQQKSYTPRIRTYKRSDYERKKQRSFMI